jgi:hypothetical protein
MIFVNFDIDFHLSIYFETKIHSRPYTANQNQADNIIFQLTSIDYQGNKHDNYHSLNLSMYPSS